MPAVEDKDRRGSLAAMSISIQQPDRTTPLTPVLASLAAGNDAVLRNLRLIMEVVGRVRVHLQIQTSVGAKGKGRVRADAGQSEKRQRPNTGVTRAATSLAMLHVPYP